MYRQSNLILALAVGLLGGFLSRYIQPAPVLAQAQTPPPKEIQAQTFVLVDDKNNIVGTFKSSVTPPGQTPTVVFLDRTGHEIWRAGVGLQKLSQR
jgi:hypothetical protein